MDYYTDGIHLYEVAARRSVQNYGLKRGVMRYVVLRDVATELCCTVDDWALLPLTPVSPTDPAPLPQAA